MADDFADRLQGAAEIDRHKLRREILREGAARLVAGRERASQTIAMAGVDRDHARDVPALVAHFCQDRLLESGEAVFLRAGDAKRVAVRPVGVLRQVAFVQEHELRAVARLRVEVRGFGHVRVDHMQDEIRVGQRALGSGDAFVLHRVCSTRAQPGRIRKAEHDPAHD